MSILSRPYFHDEEAAFTHLEAVIWANGPVCPHCGGTDRMGKIKANPTKRVRYGLYKCGDCGKQSTVKVGTVFEHARIPLHKMLQAVHLICCSKKGVSAHQLHRILEVQYRTAWFLAHRIREAMRQGEFEPLGGLGKIVEADETYFGTKEVVTKRTKLGKPSHSSKRSVLALVERGGRARMFHVERADLATVGKIVSENVDRESALYTDESHLYTSTGKAFDEHGTVKHSAGEYVRREYRKALPGEEVDGVHHIRRRVRRVVHTNTIENVFSIFKRGMSGVYQHCSEKHLHRYLAEFDFRYNHRSKLGVEDQERADKALSGIRGKRLTYHGSSTAA